MELQAKWVALVLSGNVLLPSEEEMLASIDKHYRFMDEGGIPKRYTHFLHPYEVCLQFHLSFIFLNVIFIKFI